MSDLTPNPALHRPYAKTRVRLVTLNVERQLLPPAKGRIGSEAPVPEAIKLPLDDMMGSNPEMAALGGTADIQP